MTDLTKKLKEIEKSFSINHNNKPAIIFDEAKKIIFELNQIKINQNDVQLFHRIKDIIETLYFSLPTQYLNNNSEEIINRAPESFLTLHQISSEIIDILEEIFISVIHGRNMIWFSLTRMLKERILYLMILTEDQLKFPIRCKQYYEFYEEFIWKFVSDDSKNMSSYYWWNQIYPKKSISKLMEDFKIDWYSHDSYHSHGWYWAHLDCNLSRKIVDSLGSNKQNDLIYEYFWITWYEIIALTIDWFFKFKDYMNSEYYNSVMKLLDEIYILWNKAELECSKTT